MKSVSIDIRIEEKALNKSPYSIKKRRLPLFNAMKGTFFCRRDIDGQCKCLNEINVHEI
jgi:hypothetical protein